MQLLQVAIHKFILGDTLSIPFFFEVGNMAGSLGGVAAAALVPINMGVNPVLALSAALALGDFGILPGFIAGYIIGLIAPVIEKKLPEGVNIIVGALSCAAQSYLIALYVNPVVTQAVIVTSHPVEIYSGSFIGGALSGGAAAQLGIINNAPGTASAIPGLLAPFAFNEPIKVLIALACAIVSGFVGGMMVSEFFRQRQKAADEAAA